MVSPSSTITGTSMGPVYSWLWATELPATQARQARRKGRKGIIRPERPEGQDEVSTASYAERRHIVAAHGAYPRRRRQAEGPSVAGMGTVASSRCWKRRAATK